MATTAGAVWRTMAVKSAGAAGAWASTGRGAAQIKIRSAPAKTPVRRLARGAWWNMQPSLDCVGQADGKADRPRLRAAVRSLATGFHEPVAAPAAMSLLVPRRRLPTLRPQ